MIVLATRNVALRRSCREALRDSFTIAEVTDLEGLEQALKFLEPEAVFVDPQILLPEPKPILSTLSLCYRKVAFVLFGAEGGCAAEVDSLALGARGFLRRSASPELALRAAQAVIRGELWVSRQALAAFLNNVHFGNGALDASHLSQRERQVFRIAAAGLSNKEIARSLEISERTVKSHLSNLFKKLGVTNRFGLVQLGQTLGHLEHRASASEPSKLSHNTRATGSVRR